MSKETITFNKLDLNKDIVRSIVDAGYSTPTPIQAAAIPIINSGVDLIGVAQTGTGKTAAFVLPILSYLADNPLQPRKIRPVRALIVAPTRELALQVEEAVRIYGKHAKLRSIAIFGGTNIQNQLKRLKRGADIIVATPGRLIDHMERGTIRLSELEIFTLDEADRMLDMGFQPDLKKIEAAIPERRQTLLFSATMPSSVQKLANALMYEPQLLEVGERRNPAATVEQEVCMVAHDQKADLLRHILNEEKTESVLVFSRTKYRADRISKKLGNWGYDSTVMHSNRSQNQRQRALQGFKSGKFKILVATDVAARGLDVDSISHVVNFDTPDQPEDYIHRIGRTGRAESKGNAITFVSRDERGYLKRIEKHTGKKIEVKTYDDFELIEEKGSYNDGGRGYNRSRPSGGSGRSKKSYGGKSRGGRSGGPGRPGRSGGSGRPKGSGGSGRPSQASSSDSRSNSNGGGERSTSSNSNQGGGFKKKRSFRAKKRSHASAGGGRGGSRG